VTGLGVELRGTSEIYIRTQLDLKPPIKQPWDMAPSDRGIRIAIDVRYHPLISAFLILFQNSNPSTVLTDNHSGVAHSPTVSGTQAQGN
jgi:hypothetical protein